MHCKLIWVVISFLQVFLCFESLVICFRSQRFAERCVKPALGFRSLCGVEQAPSQYSYKSSSYLFPIHSET